MKIVKKIQLKIVIFTVVKIRCMLHGRVFIMIMTLVSRSEISSHKQATVAGRPVHVLAGPKYRNSHKPALTTRSDTNWVVHMVQ